MTLKRATIPLALLNPSKKYHVQVFSDKIPLPRPDLQSSLRDHSKYNMAFLNLLLFGALVGHSTAVFDTCPEGLTKVGDCECYARTVARVKQVTNILSCKYQST